MDVCPKPPHGTPHRDGPSSVWWPHTAGSSACCKRLRSWCPFCVEAEPDCLAPRCLHLTPLAHPLPGLPGCGRVAHMPVAAHLVTPVRGLVSTVPLDRALGALLALVLCLGGDRAVSDVLALLVHHTSAQLGPVVASVSKGTRLKIAAAAPVISVITILPCCSCTA